MVGETPPFTKTLGARLYDKVSVSVCVCVWVLWNDFALIPSLPPSLLTWWELFLCVVIPADVELQTTAGNDLTYVWLTLLCVTISPSTCMATSLFIYFYSKTFSSTTTSLSIFPQSQRTYLHIISGDRFFLSHYVSASVYFSSITIRAYLFIFSKIIIVFFICFYYFLSPYQRVWGTPLVVTGTGSVTCVTWPPPSTTSPGRARWAPCLTPSAWWITTSGILLTGVIPNTDFILLLLVSQFTLKKITHTALCPIWTWLVDFLYKITVLCYTRVAEWEASRGYVWWMLPSCPWWYPVTPWLPSLWWLSARLTSSNRNGLLLTTTTTTTASNNSNSSSSNYDPLQTRLDNNNNNNSSYLK